MARGVERWRLLAARLPARWRSEGKEQTVQHEYSVDAARARRVRTALPPYGVLWASAKHVWRMRAGGFDISCCAITGWLALLCRIAGGVLDCENCGRSGKGIPLRLLTT